MEYGRDLCTFESLWRGRGEGYVHPDIWTLSKLNLYRVQVEFRPELRTPPELHLNCIRTAPELHLYCARLYCKTTIRVQVESKWSLNGFQTWTPHELHLNSTRNGVRIVLGYTARVQREYNWSSRGVQMEFKSGFHLNSTLIPYIKNRSSDGVQIDFKFTSCH